MIEECAREERDRLVDRIEEHESNGGRLDPGSDQQYPSASPPVDEDTDERPEDRIGEGDDQRRLEEPGRGVLLLRGEEHHRGHQRRLEQPVGGLADETDREELAEVGAREPHGSVPACPARCSPNRQAIRWLRLGGLDVEERGSSPASAACRSRG